ncbi:hypothetical protein LWM68_19710 [Niabella sp. W65]|nr:hypothetical protein [Niabella sp. W65]MCH7364791.1 hypothetical protein [Niabella sp. W65]
MKIKIIVIACVLFCQSLSARNEKGQPAQSNLNTNQVAQVTSPDKSVVLQVLLSASGDIQYLVKKTGQPLSNLRLWVW